MKSAWQKPPQTSPLGVRVATSRLIGKEPDLVLWGGGNTSVKTTEHDHTGTAVEVLRIKGSGWDLATIEEQGFAPVRLADVRRLAERDAMTDEAMVEYIQKSLLDPKAPRPSIETLLHAFLPHTYVDHTHADAILALTNNSNALEVIKALYGNEVAVLHYIQPGFKLAKEVLQLYQQNPTIKGIILLNHGLLTFSDDAKESYELTIRYVTMAEQHINAKLAAYPESMGTRRKQLLSSEERARKVASLLPSIRKAMSTGNRMIVRWSDTDQVLDFVNSKDAKVTTQTGPATPDHVLRTKPWALFIDVDGSLPAPLIIQAIEKRAEKYVAHYMDYYEKRKKPGSFMHDPCPRIIAIPQLGIFSSGKTYKEATIALEIYEHTTKVMMHANVLGTYQSISKQHMYDIEYWPLELYKLQLLPPEKPLSRRIALVTGATGGIGKAVVRTLLDKGATVIVTDINPLTVASDVAELKSTYGENVYGIEMDVTNQGSINLALRTALLRYGGLDIVVSNAGIAHASPIESMDLTTWQRSLDVNLTGHMLVCKEAMNLFKTQGLGGSIVMNASKNVFLPGKDFGAYSAAKAGQTQLGKVLAIEGAQYSVRVNMINADGIFQNSTLWSDDLKAKRAESYGIAPRDLELFYAQRNLLKQPILPEDVAQAVVWLCSDAASKTTGCTLTVDGGIVGAFPR